MGCGKTRVARELARQLNAVMVDLDDQIARRVGRSPAQLITEDGEAEFRLIETDTLRQVLEIGEARVIALGGGAWIQETNRRLLDDYSCLSVWLDTPFDVCWARIEASTEDRPLGRTRSQAIELYERRKPIYQLASLRIEAGDDELIDKLITRIKTALSV